MQQPAPLARRLPSLPSVATISEEHAAALCAANPCRVLTATSRYRNDPYRASVVMAPEAEAAAQAVPSYGPMGYGVPMAPIGTGTPPPEAAGPGPVDKLAAAPRRGQLPMRASLPALGAPRRNRSNTNVRRTPTPPPAPMQQQQQPTPAPAAHREEHKPAEPTAAVPKGAAKIALIQFKRTMMSALYDSGAMPDLKVDDKVIVEGDRGEHIATVARVNVKKSKSTPTIVVRKATPADLEQHERVKEAEAVALETCRAHAQRLGLSAVMSVADVEYQLDFGKLTVFFAARDPSSFVDFRSLQRALYQHFRCRIWIADV